MELMGMWIERIKSLSTASSVRSKSSHYWFFFEFGYRYNCKLSGLAGNAGAPRSLAIAATLKFKEEPHY